ncbi:glycogen debranching N-terminal domain-containing protein [Rhodocista pekingensis]|uniref:Glycogen debranching N-terminal domain-containing protein n=1 Tax=Rhodocista pekingensis TaxID=201185 RepID=A0ABW2KWX6_9PROT
MIPAAGGQPGATGVPQFYVAATSSLQERRPRMLKHGDTFAVFDHNGDVVPRPSGPEGVFHRDTRHLSRLELSIDGQRPMLLGSTVRSDNALLACDLTNPDLFVGDRLVLEKDTLHIRRAKFLWRGACRERVIIRNHGLERRSLTLGIGFGCDFADLFEVRGTTRQRRGQHAPPVVAPAAVTHRYVGLDGVERATRFGFAPAPSRLSGDMAAWDMALGPGEQAVLYLDVAFDAGEARPAPGAGFLRDLRLARRALRFARSGGAQVTTSNAMVGEMLARSAADLRMLVTDKPGGPYPYAGIPWFNAAFGRDGLITALLVLWADPEMARGVLHFLGETQATATDPAADAEPGKILHETRGGEMAALGEVPFGRYYGSADATPLFVMLAGAYFARTGNAVSLRPLWPHLKAALAWLDGPGDRDGDGFVEYGRRTDGGLANQGWKDSHDSIFHACGTLARGPIALCEVQAYAFAAKQAGAILARAFGEPELAVRLDDSAEALRVRFEAAFWCEDLGTYALALDGDKRPCRVRSSNAGHALLAGIASPERAARVADTLMSRGSFSGWGIRTLAAGEVRYNPMSYHNGSVWPHDNALVALGFARYGFHDRASRVLEAIAGAAGFIDLRRLPELFCGFPRRPGLGPTPYPVACSPQAWAAAAPLGLLQACLGLRFDPAGRAVRVGRPVLPPSVGEVAIRGLAVGGGSVDLRFTRLGDDVDVSVGRRNGGARLDIGP